ncbi:sll0787 family AIR synthase-like protein [Synechococcus sp. Cruz-9H2]|uniref:sll0787 family AIR synthase-like protein n=1 Tax=unclassified Synechococcus TaxID=2626047 RepID=UPI0020CD7506|nr:MULTISPECIES: sll0787 family AIR synthase-like protein [unclassified Synechococcus]MCP9820567.1 sll0787 family AIR synthase-like protein [Synechococcus sp. Cruz-9H2]MCP9844796.1 sll0787 family AIR synthase-like protein [Synechococcus sp. Edmonson 11F2]MCP9856923.1 sll0787 family AIR synthase-like protein [Synechococcus sp. Cruz-9C9]MCP9864209.1 sll0787 family AIR synthase-like protein [Synechococcus sp. Cruz-7E5]MCP9871473.1 sll0787 family AIR synthase-like protein [Synechococcus sp. Cruz-7
MSEPDLEVLVSRLRQLAGWRGKTDIQRPAAHFPHLPFPALGIAAALGDDAALLPAAAGSLLLACEGLHPELVEQDPWFAGWSGVLVNLSDIAAMGGRPLAMVNSLWSGDARHADRIFEGMRVASQTFQVPVVGGHTNLHSPYNALSVAVLGVAAGPVLSARFARPGDHCHLLINTSGHVHHPYPFWDAATRAEPELLRRHLALMAELAEAGTVHAAKDISMGGLIGTAVMFAEAAGCGLELDLNAILPPPGLSIDDWLSCFPSYGYLLAAVPEQDGALEAAVAPFADLQLACIGRFGPVGGGLSLRQAGRCHELWRGGETLTGFGARC